MIMYRFIQANSSILAYNGNLTCSEMSCGGSWVRLYLAVLCMIPIHVMYKMSLCCSVVVSEQRRFVIKVT